MGREEREHEVRDIAMAERMQGPILEASVYNHSGCPKCGFPSFGKGYCMGRTVETEKIKEACRREGEHLHCQCQGCGFRWLERPKDWREPSEP